MDVNKSMEVSTILDQIDDGRMVLPTFQRGYVWKREQVRGLMDSLYRGHPVGSLLVWVTPSDNVDHRGSQEIDPGMVQVLLDGQQRITSLYGIIRGKPPAFFDGDAKAFKAIHFHLQNEEFHFHQPAMNGDPLWIDVSALMQRSFGQLKNWIDEQSSETKQFDEKIWQLWGIRSIEFHVAKVEGSNETVEVVVDIFNRVNSGGTKLSQGDLALAKICASWPKGREIMKAKIDEWKGRDYDFTLDWLLRNVNAIVKGEARFRHLHNVPTERIQKGLDDAERSINYSLTLIGDRLGLDHSRVLFGRNALPVMSRYIDQRGGGIADDVEQDRLLYWYFLSALRGRFSGSTESKLDEDFKAIRETDGAIDRLIAELHAQHNSKIEPRDFEGSTRGARFYPVLYALTRFGEARDWGSKGEVLKRGLLGKESKLELHHIFPQAQLRKTRYSKKPDIHALANFCFLRKETNGKIGSQLPKEYFRKIDRELLKSQWIPVDDEELWEIDNYPRFLEARRQMLADAANTLLDSLRHAAPTPEVDAAPAGQPVAAAPAVLADADEEAILADVREFVRGHGLAEGQDGYELTHPDTDDLLAVLDLAWPDGLQEELTEPVALLLNEEPDTLQVVVNDHRFRPFTDPDAFKRYVETLDKT